MKPPTIDLDDIDGYEFEDVCKRIFTKVYKCRIEGTTYHPKRTQEGTVRRED